MNDIITLKVQWRHFPQCGLRALPGRRFSAQSYHGTTSKLSRSSHDPTHDLTDGSFQRRNFYSPKKMHFHLKLAFQCEVSVLWGFMLWLLWENIPSTQWIRSDHYHMEHHIDHHTIDCCTVWFSIFPRFADLHQDWLQELHWPRLKMLESRLETLQGGRNIVLIWGITKPFQQNEVPCYTCKEFRALEANVISKLHTLWI